MPIITVSGAVGSGARELGLLVAQKLGLDLVDQQILVDAARRLGVRVERVAERDERCLGLRERLAQLMRGFLERSALLGADPLAGGTGLEVIFSRTYTEMASQMEEGQELEVDDALYLKVLTGILQELAYRGDVVLLGRGSHVVLRDFPGALHVLALAPKEMRVQRYAEREGLSLDEAARQVAQADRGRHLFYRRFWKVDPDDPHHYHLAVETSRLPLAVAAEVVAVAAAALEREGEGRP
ncbi:Cytidylate kinase [bacterium HR24]|nr:Cytidylate kinase [bacterium HR24]